MNFIDQVNLIACHCDDDILLGSIKLNKEDDYYWFHPSETRTPLTCRQLIRIAGKISELNKDGA